MDGPVAHMEEMRNAYWPVTSPSDGGSRDISNVGILTQHITASEHRRPGLEKTSSFNVICLFSCRV